jgi:hypothetical protein
MTDWTFAHTIECAVPAAFAWAFWTNTSNWALDADVESVVILGPFEAGTRGVTHSKSSGRIDWQLIEVTAPHYAVLDFPVPGVTARFDWTFEESAGRTRITQRANLSGERVADYAGSILPALEAGIPAGMQKLREAMEAAGRAEPSRI